MVVLRDGKRYDVGDDEPENRPRRRASTGATTSSAGPQQRRSRRSVAAEATPYSDPEPPSPAATPRRSKRTRPQQLDTVPSPLPEEQLEDAEELDTAKDQDIMPAVATPRSPRPGEGSPSPLPKKKARRDAKRSSSAHEAGRGGSSSWLAAAGALAVLLAVAAAALWPQHGDAVTAAVTQALESPCAFIDSLQLGQQLAAAQAAAAASAASAAQLLRQHAGQAQAQLHTVLLQLHVRYPSLIPDKLPFGAGSGGGATDPHAWSAEALAAILPEGEQWQELAGDVSDRLRTPAAQRGHKATALLLACASDDDCSEAAAALAVLPPSGDACSLTLDASVLAAAGSHQPAAMLQAKLAPFLRRCPRGLVILLRCEALPVAALSALHNGLSELGGFQHDGLVRGSQAAYALLLQLPATDVAAAIATSDAAAADAGIKDAFLQLQQQQLSTLQAAAGGDVARGDALAALGRTLRTLHRRLDFAAPVRLGAAAEDELEQLEQAAAAAAAQAAAAAAARATAQAAQQQEEEQEAAYD